ncbi:MAG TPA: hypothetical protein PKE38_15915 [Ignavibacteriaceae bacterium]|nr:hypothetical protein [Ignavibacteriaceae bacterium]
MIYKKYLPTLVCGFAAAVLSTVPGIKNFSCCLLVPGAAAISILLDKKINPSNEKILLENVLGFGFLTGLFATIFIVAFEMLLSYITKTNELVQNLPEIELTIRQIDLGSFMNEYLKILKSAARDIEKKGFSLNYLLIMLSINFVINSIFGMIGGALGMSLANKKLREDETKKW